MLFGVKLFHYINNNLWFGWSTKLICEKPASSRLNENRRALSPKLSFFLSDGYTVHESIARQKQIFTEHLGKM